MFIKNGLHFEIMVEAIFSINKIGRDLALHKQLAYKTSLKLIEAFYHLLTLYLKYLAESE